MLLKSSLAGRMYASYEPVGDVESSNVSRLSRGSTAGSTGVVTGVDVTGSATTGVGRQNLHQNTH